MTQSNGARRRDPRTREVPEPIRAAVQELVHELGASKAAAALGVSKDAVKSVACGEWVMPGTIALLEAAVVPKGAA